MQIHPLGEPLPNPNICFICESKPPEAAKTCMVDTLRNFQPGILTNLNGRKLVCGSCVAEMAELMGCLSPVSAAELRWEIAELTVALHENEATHRTIEQARALWNALGALFGKEREEDEPEAKTALDLEPGQELKPGVVLVQKGVISPEDFAQLAAATEPPARKPRAKKVSADA